MRVFVALEIDNRAVVDALVAMQKELVETGADLKPVERQNIHFTVKFLGEVSPSTSADVDQRLKGLSLNGCEAEVRGVGAFPSPNRPSVVWAGVAAEGEPLIMPAVRSVLEALNDYGEPERRPYRPHATLARVRSGRQVDVLAGCITRNSGRSFGKTLLKSLKLKSSVLTPSGPVYTDIGAYTLQ